MRIKTLLLIFCLNTSAIFAQGEYGTFSGETSLENRYYINESAYGNIGQGDSTVQLTPEYSYSWDNDRKVIVVIPHFTLGQLDKNKNSFDIREFSYVAAWNKVELRAGISKVFWGVSESQHLVDIINQTDAIKNIDGEDKLGQAMINLTLLTSFGSFDYFMLPYFRERTFSGIKGRLRGPLAIDFDNPIYTHEDEKRHLDHAFRWSHYWGSLEWGLSYFWGTDRTPDFVVNKKLAKLTPVYVQTEQAGIDIQYIYEDWLFKGEVISKDGQLEKRYLGVVTGFEYTFTNKLGGMDIGLLGEWIYDERGIKSDTGFYDASFIATRIAFNDEKSAEILVGSIFNNEKLQLETFRIEASRRISDRWKWELEVQLFSSSKKRSILYQIKKDDYIQFTQSLFF